MKGHAFFPRGENNVNVKKHNRRVWTSREIYIRRPE